MERRPTCFSQRNKARAILLKQNQMGKYKAFKKKTDAPPQVKQGVPCLIILGLIMILVFFVMYGALKS